MTFRWWSATSFLSMKFYTELQIITMKRNYVIDGWWWHGKPSAYDLRSYKWSSVYASIPYSDLFRIDTWHDFLVPAKYSCYYIYYFFKHLKYFYFQSFLREPVRVWIAWAFHPPTLIISTSINNFFYNNNDKCQ